jgi:hypothetical protein
MFMCIGELKMSNKILLASPVTQTAESIKQLIKYFHHGQEPAEMPDFWRITASMVLVRNNKGDAYYVTTPKSCSCPSANYRPGKPCKHQRTYFPQPKTPAPESMESIRPEGKWPGGFNGPVDEILGVA